MSSTTSRILVVDDEPTARELTIGLLEADGFECDPACHGAQAIDMLEQAHYDAVVTDLKMPTVHGHALAVELLTRDERPVIFVVTAVEEPKLVRDLLIRGVDDVFFKPPDFKLLSLKLSFMIEQRQRLAKV